MLLEQYRKDAERGNTGPLSGKPISSMRLFILTFLACTLSMGILVFYITNEDESYYGEESNAYEFDEGCNVASIDIHGDIYTYQIEPDDVLLYTEVYSRDVVNALEEANENENIKAILLDIDSYGGIPQAALEIEEAIQATEKPSVAWIRAAGTSAAYWAATGATTIVASPVSDVGSIGVTQSYIDYAQQNEDSGITFNSLTTGVLKDVGSREKALTQEEKDYLQKGIEEVLSVFVGVVAENRKLSKELVRELADGSSITGAVAKEKGLVDIVGSKKEVTAELKRMIGEEPVVCNAG